MRLVFYAQVRPDPTRPGYLVADKVTKHKPTGPQGQVIKFDIEIPESVMYPEVKASLVGLETVTDQAVASLQASAASLKKKQP